MGGGAHLNCAPRPSMSTQPHSLDRRVQRCCKRKQWRKTSFVSVFLLFSCLSWTLTRLLLALPFPALPPCNTFAHNSAEEKKNEEETNAYTTETKCEHKHTHTPKSKSAYARRLQTPSRLVYAVRVCGYSGKTHKSGRSNCAAASGSTTRSTSTRFDVFGPPASSTTTTPSATTTQKPASGETKGKKERTAAVSH